MTTIISAARTLAVTTRTAASSNWSAVRRRPSLIVLHSTEGGEGGGATDANVAAGLAKPKPAGQRTSFHYAVDADSASLCVPEACIAWHCGHTGNLIGIGVELCGTARQSSDQWLDGASMATLRNAARLVADICARWAIPAEYLDAHALNNGLPHGITTHADVSAAWRESTHWDPGPNFPIVSFVDAVRVALLLQPNV